MSERIERGRWPLAGRRVVVVGGTSGMGRGAMKAALEQALSAKSELPP